MNAARQQLGPDLVLQIANLLSAIREYLAFYPDRVDAIEVGVED